LFNNVLIAKHHQPDNEQPITNNFLRNMTRYFIVLGKQHTPTSFRVVLLLEDRTLVHRRLELYGPGELNLEENVTTDRYVVDAFLRKREYAGRQWQEVAREDYAPLEKQWRASYPAAAARPGRKTKVSPNKTTG
jgi:hypothetical protein